MCSHGAALSGSRQRTGLRLPQPSQVFSPVCVQLIYGRLEPGSLLRAENQLQHEDGRPDVPGRDQQSISACLMIPAASHVICLLLSVVDSSMPSALEVRSGEPQLQDAGDRIASQNLAGIFPLDS